MTTQRRKCPDGGTCHHGCGSFPEPCWRRAACAPLSGVFPGDRWPAQTEEELLAAAVHLGEQLEDAEETEALIQAGDAGDVAASLLTPNVCPAGGWNGPWPCMVHEGVCMKCGGRPDMTHAVKIKTIEGGAQLLKQYRDTMVRLQRATVASAHRAALEARGNLQPASQHDVTWDAGWCGHWADLEFKGDEQGPVWCACNTCGAVWRTSATHHKGQPIVCRN